MKMVATFVRYLMQSGQSILLNVFRLLTMVLLLIPILLTKICEWLKRFLTRKNFKEKKDKKPCILPFPEDVMRRPDPCIYSQFYLMDQSLPVTWNNPDIWVSKLSSPNVIEPDSYHMEANTKYLITVQVHNASVDPAIGVRVRLVYRPWSFNSPDLLPVETDTSGNEVIRIANVAPMGSTLVQFIWLTPNVPAGQDSSHYCIQAILHHPLDINTHNNLGQENTLVYRRDMARLAPDDLVELTVPLFNHGKKTERYTFRTFHYTPDEKETIELKLKSNVGRAKLKTSRRLQQMIPAVNLGIPKGRNTNLLGLEWVTNVVTIKNKYTGYETVRERMRRTSYALPAALNFALMDDLKEVELGPGQSKDIRFTIRNTGNHPEPTHYQITIAAITEHQTIAGGVTIQFTY